MSHSHLAHDGKRHALYVAIVPEDKKLSFMGKGVRGKGGKKFDVLD